MIQKKSKMMVTPWKIHLRKTLRGHAPGHINAFINYPIPLSCIRGIHCRLWRLRVKKIIIREKSTQNPSPFRTLLSDAFPLRAFIIIISRRSLNNSNSHIVFPFSQENYDDERTSIWRFSQSSSHQSYFYINPNASLFRNYDDWEIRDSLSDFMLNFHWNAASNPWLLFTLVLAAFKVYFHPFKAHTSTGFRCDFQDCRCVKKL